MGVNEHGSDLRERNSYHRGSFGFYLCVRLLACFADDHQMPRLRTDHAEGHVYRLGR